MGTLEQTGDAREFWNAKARTFPRYEEGADTYEARMLRLIRENGVDPRGKRILDVGCGSGMYTIRLAQEARSVLAVDISDEMLRILADDAAAMRLANITCVRSGWDVFETDERFDIVFASMTPAVNDDQTREKLLRFSDAWVVFMGFTERMASDVMEPLYAHYAVTPNVFNNAVVMTEKRGLCTIVVLHTLSFALRYAENILLLHEGRQRYFGASQGLTAASLTEVFQIPISIQNIGGVPYALF